MLWWLVFGAWVVLMAVYTCQWISLGKQASLQPTCEEAPPVTVVVAMRNEEKHAETLVRNVLVQTYRQLQLIVVDDASDDRTAAILQPYADAGRLLLLRAKGEGKKKALAQGVLAATTEYVLFTDADCQLSERWAETHVACLQQHRAALSVGLVKTLGGSKLERIEAMSLQAVTAGSVRCGHGVMCSGANLAVRRSVYLDCMNELQAQTASGDDMFLLSAVKRRKARVVFVPYRHGIVTTGAAGGLRAFVGQRARWVGKARYYTDFYTVAVACLTLLVQVLLLAAWAFATTRPQWLWAWPICLAADFPLLWLTARHLGQTADMRVYPLAFVLYPFYVVFILIRSILPVQWKQRTL